MIIVIEIFALLGYYAV